jgi:hypothetical protein
MYLQQGGVDMGNSYTSCHKQIITILAGVVLFCSGIVYAGDAGLPELSGLSVAQGYSLHNTGAASGASPENGGDVHQNQMRKRLAGKLNVSITDTIHLGMQRYTRLDGRKRYGFGLRKQLDNTEVNLMLTSSGMNLNTNTEGFGLGMSIEDHAPGDSEGSAYVGFGIGRQW